jgi:predicted chitinase
MLIDRKKFYDNFPSAKLSKAKATESRKVGFEAIFDAWDEIEHFDIREWLAYALATTWHETGKRMQPVREGFANTDAQAYDRVAAYCHKKGIDNYARRPKNGMSYYGRGYVQLTHATNYVEMGKRLGLGKKLYDNPDLAMQPGTAAKKSIMAYISSFGRMILSKKSATIWDHALKTPCVLAEVR